MVDGEVVEDPEDDVEVETPEDDIETNTKTEEQQTEHLVADVDLPDDLNKAERKGKNPDTETDEITENIF